MALTISTMGITRAPRPMATAYSRRVTVVKEKAAAMQAFHDLETPVLVATTVVEAQTTTTTTTYMAEAEVGVVAVAVAVLV